MWKVKVTQLCPTLCDPIDYTVHGILQAKILEWVAFPSPGDLPNPGMNTGLPHSGQILYQLSHKRLVLTLQVKGYQQGLPCSESHSETSSRIQRDSV